MGLQEAVKSESHTPLVASITSVFAAGCRFTVKRSQMLSRFLILVSGRQVGPDQERDGANELELFLEGPHTLSLL